MNWRAEPVPRQPLNQCGACGQDFGGLRLFDAHRVGKHTDDYAPDLPDGRRCLTVGEMRKRGWTRNNRGRWTDPKRAHDIQRRQVAEVPVRRDGVDAEGDPTRKSAQISTGPPPRSQADPVNAHVRTRSSQ